MVNTIPFAKVPAELFIGGQWRGASDGSRFDVADPGTGDLLASVASASGADVGPIGSTAADGCAKRT